MNLFIEFLLITVIAGVASLSFSKLSIGEWWYPELSWKVVRVLFVVLTAVFNVAYFVFVKS